MPLHALIATRTSTRVRAPRGSQRLNRKQSPCTTPEGTATLMIDNITNSISWEITVANILLPPIGAPIHQQVAGMNGGDVVNFSGQLSGANLADPDLANLLANPTGFYVNIHNEAFPSGAIRGQLGSPVPAPAGVLLLATGIAALGGRRLVRPRSSGLVA